MGKFALDNFVSDPDGAFISANIKSLKDQAYHTHVVKNSQARRLDLISYAIYETVELKWLLIYINDIHDLDQLVEGFVIYYPSLTDIIAQMMRSLEAKNLG